jgi:hypothetical protein
MDKVQLFSASSVKGEKHILLIIEDNDQQPPEYYGFATWGQSQHIDFFKSPQELFERLIKDISNDDKPYSKIKHAGEIFIDPNEINNVLK